MKLSKDQLILITSFYLFYKSLENFYFSLVEIYRFFAVEFLIPKEYLIVLISIFIILLFVVGFKYFLIISLKKMIRVLLLYLISYTIIFNVNNWIGQWLGTLKKDNLMKVMELDYLIIFAPKYFMLLTVISLLVEYWRRNRRGNTSK